MADLQAPVRVSPVIKMVVPRSRYFVGAFHFNRFSKKENALREVEAKLKPERDAKLAAEKKAAAEREMADLEKQMR